MEVNICADTCFLIDLQREKRRRNRPATSFLESCSKSKFWISAVAWGEIAEGRNAENEAFLLELRNALELLPITEAVAEKYGEITRDLRARGLLISSNDLWIASAALERNFPLLSRNSSEYSRVHGLRLLTY